MIRRLAQKLFGVKSPSKSYVESGKAIVPIFTEVFQELAKALKEEDDNVKGFKRV